MRCAMFEDLSNCKIIKEPITFYNYYDFVEKRFIIKYYYDRFTDIQREFYKYYVYANSHMIQMYKDRIWDFLNGDCSEKELLNIVKFYKEH